jgi:Leucine-rich repeat (LRR) protein
LYTSKSYLLTRICIGTKENIELWVLDYDGRMNGTIPDSLYNLEKSKILSINGHAFQGSIKTEIGNLKNLTELWIDSNEFTGTLPTELGLCEKLRE